MGVIGAPAQLGLAMRFEVVIDGYLLGSWSSCKGLDVTFKHDPVRELGEHTTVTWLPGRPEYAAVTLQRAMEKCDWDTTRAWLRSVTDDGWFGRAGRPRLAVVTLHDARRDAVATWKLINVLPTAWKGPQLDAASNKVAVETLQLTHEGFLDD